MKMKNAVPARSADFVTAELFIAGILINANQWCALKEYCFSKKIRGCDLNAAASLVLFYNVIFPVNNSAEFLDV